MMKIIDISWPLISGITTYKNKEDFVAYPLKEWQKDGFRESRLVCGAHVGTHIDAPSHFIQDGVSIDSISLNQLCGPCIVLDMTQVKDAITAQDLEKHELKAPRVLFKTRNSKLAPIDPFDPDFIYLDASGAAYLQAKKIVAVGIDYLGIERQQQDHPTHRSLFNAGIVIIEGLRLTDVEPGLYTLICLPLALVGVEAAPARAVLLPA